MPAIEWVRSVSWHIQWSWFDQQRTNISSTPINVVIYQRSIDEMPEVDWASDTVGVTQDGWRNKPVTCESPGGHRGGISWRTLSETGTS